MLTRRRFLSQSTLAATAASLTLCGCRTQPVRAVNPPAVSPLASSVSLAEAGRRNGVLVGSAVSVQGLRRSEAYADLVSKQCSIIVPENEMKFASLRPAPDTFFFDNADYLMAFAERNKILVRGHNFMWHRQLPGWFDSYVTQANAAQVLVQHIEKVGGRYAGRMQSWDVCNEVIQVDDKLPGGLRNAPWYKLLGVGAYDLAFRTARRVDPHALLCYNDYGIEGESPEQAAKRQAVLGFLRGLQQRNVPIDGVGIQAHLAAGPSHVYGPGLVSFMNEVQSMGLKLFITELDVNDRDLPSSIAQRDEQVANVYGQFLGTALANRDVTTVLTWGLTDKYTWLNGEDSRADHLPERCLPFDDQLKPVLAYEAELAALLRAPSRALVTGRRQA